MLPKLCDFVLENGIAAASLRPLAKAADTSDRMLIYHFGSKEALIDEILERLAADFAAKLSSALGTETVRPPGALLATLLTVLRGSEFAGYIRLWLDIVAEAKRGDTRFGDTGAAIVGFFTSWIEDRLACSGPERATTAALILTLIEGAHALDAVGRFDVADQALTAAFPLGPT